MTNPFASHLYTNEIKSHEDERIQNIDEYNSNSNIDENHNENDAEDDAPKIPQIDVNSEAEIKAAVEMKKPTCKYIIKKMTGKWATYFNKMVLEFVYPAAEQCGMHMMRKLIKEHLEQDVSISDMKDILVNTYEPYVNENPDYVVNTLYIEGKANIINRIRSGEITLENSIMANSYYFTDLDIWTIATHYGIPIILYSRAFIKINYKKLVELVPAIDDKTYFVRTASVKRNVIPSYSIMKPAGGFKVDKSNLNEAMQQRIRDSIGTKPVSIDKYIKSSSKSGYEERKKRRFVIIRKPIKDKI
jgi:hypothetical protein